MIFLNIFRVNNSEFTIQYSKILPFFQGSFVDIRGSFVLNKKNFDEVFHFLTFSNVRKRGWQALTNSILSLDDPDMTRTTSLGGATRVKEAAVHSQFPNLNPTLEECFSEAHSLRGS